MARCQLLQQDETGNLCAIDYAKWSWYSSEISMHNYNSAKIELLVLKYVVTEKFFDYFLGLKFQVSVDTIPLAYVKERKLGPSQI